MVLIIILKDFFFIVDLGRFFERLLNFFEFEDLLFDRLFDKEGDLIWFIWFWELFVWYNGCFFVLWNFFFCFGYFGFVLSCGFNGFLRYCCEVEYCWGLFWEDIGFLWVLVNLEVIRFLLIVVLKFVFWGLYNCINNILLCCLLICILYLMFRILFLRKEVVLED